ncbi:hypothetical protein BO71DRAFT_16195 [Aspergillus ellipticus CBS 707.79]|uniref:Uncharacterized protein n=1 Tax=Aspergillus ellipticus CBS 707.79 TaxID=1448320 RepID=A0A319D686_9EURO|nr:hypothetical protein BO71DRAFT_16195 [Aspergillus ellipticus CBS 707.79]
MVVKVLSQYPELTDVHIPLLRDCLSSSMPKTSILELAIMEHLADEVRNTRVIRSGSVNIFHVRPQTQSAQTGIGGVIHDKDFARRRTGRESIESWDWLFELVRYQHLQNGDLYMHLILLGIKQPYLEWLIYDQRCGPVHGAHFSHCSRT